MSWKSFQEEAKTGAESGLDVCDYFVDEVIEPWKIPGRNFIIKDRSKVLFICVLPKKVDQIENLLYQKQFNNLFFDIFIVFYLNYANSEAVEN